MERLWILVCIVVLGFTACKSKNDESTTPVTPSSSVLAFPGADGGGKYVAGGRGTSIHVIYSLDDDPKDPQPGTLRYALEKANGPRVIVFNVAGRIDLDFPIEVKHGQITILGQTAPGDGICISGYPLKIYADDVIIRFMRFRLGDLNKLEADALSVMSGAKNIMIDHCSCSWSTDECLSIYGVSNATVQYCIVSESLNNSVHAKGAHGYAGIWGGENTTFHHNLLAHHSSRMPRFDHDYVTTTNVGPTDFINNVVYNWSSNSAYGGESSSATGNQRQYNFIANYYKPGKATKSGVKERLLNPTTSCDHVGTDGKHQGCIPSYGGTIIPGKFYVMNNIMDGSTSVTTDNWKGVHPDDNSRINECRSSSRFSFENCLTGEQAADHAYETVLAKAGCSLKRDAVDARIVNEVQQGSYTYKGSNGSTGGLIDTPSDVGGWPSYSGTVTDSDFDGIPDEWETSHGLNPNDRKDAVLTTIQPPYMNIEAYANELVKDLY